MLLHFLSAAVCHNPLRLARTLRLVQSDGRDCALVLAEQPLQPIVPPLSRRNLALYELPFGWAFGVKWRELLSNLHPEEVHIHGLLSRRCSQALVQTATYGAPFQVHCPTLSIENPNLRLFTKPTLWYFATSRLHKATAIHVTTQRQAQTLHTYGIPSDRIQVHPDPLANIQQRADYARTKLLVGYLEPGEQRGVDAVVQSLHSMRRMGASNRVCIILNAQRDECRALQAKFIEAAPEVDSTVVPFGAPEQHDERIAQADTFVLLTESDNADRITERALALGTPIVALPATLAGQLREQHCGQTCQWTEGSFYQSVLRILQSDEPDRRAWGDSARQLCDDAGAFL